MGEEESLLTELDEMGIKSAPPPPPEPTAAAAGGGSADDGGLPQVLEKDLERCEPPALKNQPLVVLDSPGPILWMTKGWGGGRFHSTMPIVFDYDVQLYLHGILSHTHSLERLMH